VYALPDAVGGWMCMLELDVLRRVRDFLTVLYSITFVVLSIM
jgi:hypothetical protein